MINALDEQIQNEILNVLFQAYRNPKGKFRNVTFNVLQHEVRQSFTCEREDVLRELRYLMEKKQVKSKKERYAGYKIGNAKMPGGSTEYYFLSGDAIDALQSPGKYSKIGFILTRHNVKILKKSSDFAESQEYIADFQPKMCFLPIDADVAEGDKIQLIINGQVMDEKTVGVVDKYFGGPIEHIEVKWFDKNGTHGGTTVNITDSPIFAPVTVGDSNYVISYNASSDTNKVLQLIEGRKDIESETKSKISDLVKQELPSLLEKPDLGATKPFLEKVKSLGQTWLVPIITQMIATYFQHQLGINQ